MKSTAFDRLLRKWVAGRVLRQMKGESGGRIWLRIEASFWRRKRWLMWVAGGLLAAVVVAAGIAAVLLHRAEPFLRARIVEELRSAFMRAWSWTAFICRWRMGCGPKGKDCGSGRRAEVEGVTVPGSSRAADEPLIRLDEFRFHAPLRYSPGKPFHISLVELKGMDVHMPPLSHFGHAAEGSAAKARAGHRETKQRLLQLRGGHGSNAARRT